MSGLGRYPLNIPSLSEAFSNFQHGLSNSNQRRDRLDYDDRRFNRDRDRDSRRDDDFRRDSGGSRGRSSRERFSPEVSSNYLNFGESKCEISWYKIHPKSTCYAVLIFIIFHFLCVHFSISLQLGTMLFGLQKISILKQCFGQLGGEKEKKSS